MTLINENLNRQDYVIFIGTNKSVINVKKKKKNQCYNCSIHTFQCFSVERLFIAPPLNAATRAH